MKSLHFLKLYVLAILYLVDSNLKKNSKTNNFFGMVVVVRKQSFVITNRKSHDFVHVPCAMRMQCVSN